MLGIKYPVFQGGMAWIADGKLAAAVSEGGGLGIIAAGNAPGEYVREQIKIAKEKTTKPIGVNIMLMSPFVDEVAKVENLEVTDEEIDQQLEMIAMQNHVTKEEVLEKVKAEDLKRDYKRIKASQFIIENIAK